MYWNGKRMKEGAKHAQNQNNPSHIYYSTPTTYFLLQVGKGRLQDNAVGGFHARITAVHHLENPPSQVTGDAGAQRVTPEEDSRGSLARENPAPHRQSVLDEAFLGRTSGRVAVAAVIEANHVIAHGGEEFVQFDPVAGGAMGAVAVEIEDDRLSVETGVFGQRRQRGSGVGRAFDGGAGVARRRDVPNAERHARR